MFTRQTPKPQVRLVSQAFLEGVPAERRIADELDGTFRPGDLDRVFAIGNINLPYVGTDTNSSACFNSGLKGRLVQVRVSRSALPSHERGE